MSLPILLIVGKAGSGKDTAAKFLAEVHGRSVIAGLADSLKSIASHFVIDDARQAFWGSSEQRKGSVRLVPLDRIDWERLGANMGIPYSAVTRVRDWYEKFWSTVGGETSARDLLQRFGTDCVRNTVAQNFWSAKVVSIATTLLSTSNVSYDRETCSVVPSPGATTNLVIIPDGRFRSEIVEIKRVGGFVCKIVRPSLQQKMAHESEIEMDTVPNGWYDFVIQNKDGLDLLYQKMTKISNQLP